MNTDNHNVEHAAAGRPIEFAAARSQPAPAALRNAPAWVREKIAEIRSEAGGDTVVEYRGGVEYGTEDRATAYAARSMRHAPPSIVRAINRNRRAAGLVEIASPRPEPTGPSVWVMRDGRLVPASSVASLPPARTKPSPRTSTLPQLLTRVVILPAYGDAPAAHVGGRLPETISPTAFGRAADLTDWDLRLGHHGARLVLPGQRLRAHDTPHGLVVEWLVDHRLPMAGDALRAINAGAGVSVAMKVAESRTMRLPSPTTVVTRARLLHVAIIPDDQPAYGAATALAFPASRPGDAGELRKQIEKVVAEARFRQRRSSW